MTLYWRVNNIPTETAKDLPLRENYVATILPQLLGPSVSPNGLTQRRANHHFCTQPYSNSPSDLKHTTQRLGPLADPPNPPLDTAEPHIYLRQSAEMQREQVSYGIQMRGTGSFQ